MGNINVIGAPGGAGLTGSTDPDGVAVQNLIRLPEVKEAHDFMRYNIHGEC